MTTATVGGLARPQAWTVGPDDTLESVGRGLVGRRLHWAPVVDAAGVPIGVLSAWDLLRFAVDGRPGTMPAWQACTYRPASVTASTTTAEAARLMRELHVHHLPVVGADGKLSGVVSSLDLLG